MMPRHWLNSLAGSERDTMQWGFRRTRTHPQDITIKRIFDVAVALCALFVTCPLILTGAFLVKLTSRGPAFYRARRAGLGNQPFDMLKIRTMRVGLDTTDRRVTDLGDERVTRVGLLLRKGKIDELPQFWNVLKGDMSIVGPRPEDWDIVQNYYTPEQRRLLAVRPGIASPVDLAWYPDMTYHDPPPPGVPVQEHYLTRHMPIQVAEALQYIDNQSLWLDLTVVARLLHCVLICSWLPPKRRALR